MVSVFYIAAIITVLASVKAISGTQSMNALLYFVISLLATAVVFFIMGAYFSAALVVVLFVGAVSLLFLSVLSLTNIRKDMVEQNKRGISPKIWLGPLILVFVLFVTLIYGIASNDYPFLSSSRLDDNSDITDMLLGAYILVIELAVLLLLCALVIAYHFMYRLYINKEHNLSAAKHRHQGEPHDSTHA